MFYQEEFELGSPTPWFEELLGIINYQFFFYSQSNLWKKNYLIPNVPFKSWINVTLYHIA